MEEDPVQNNQLITLTKYIRSGECILFLGAGVNAIPPEGCLYKYSLEESPPLGSKLSEELAEICDYKKNFPHETEFNLQRVSLCYELNPLFGRRELIDELTQRLIDGKKASPILKMLAALPFKIFVTTNYDKLLEQALRKNDKEPKVIVYNPDDKVITADVESDPTEQQPLVFKMHGDLDKPESIVITSEDYITFIQRMSDKDQLHPVPQTVRYRMQKWPTLFIGYSLLDYNLRLLFRTLRWRIDEAYFPKAFSIDKGPDPLILQVYQNKKGFVTFVIKDLWSFVPELYKTIMGKEFQQ